MKPISDLAADILRARGIDPAALDEMPEPTPFDPAAWRLEMAREALAAQTPKRFQDDVPGDLHPVVGEWIRLFTTGAHPRPSLLLVGPTGSGKSHQAFQALRTVVLATAAANRGLTFRAVEHTVLNAMTRPKPDNSHHWALDPFEECDLLLLDDVGAAKESDWNTNDVLLRLVNRRWANRRSTIYTTNLNELGMTEGLSERVASRMLASMRAVLRAPDYRRAGGAR